MNGMRYTPVSIAHRPSKVRDADRIEVFERGRIYERGKHEQPMMLSSLSDSLHFTVWNGFVQFSEKMHESVMPVYYFVHRGFENYCYHTEIFFTVFICIADQSYFTLVDSVDKKLISVAATKIPRRKGKGILCP